MSGLVEGITGSVIAAAIVGMAVAVYRRYFGQRIAIISPAEHGSLVAAEKRARIMAHPVLGTVKHLRKGHRIWLVVVNEAGGQFWPQSFAPVETDEAKGTWKGYINVFEWQYRWENITIMALIAPPTTQEYFNHFQRVGKKTGFEPLSAIPDECKWRHTAQARVLPAK